MISRCALCGQMFFSKFKSRCCPECQEAVDGQEGGYGGA